jgi:hypothetical protein
MNGKQIFFALTLGTAAAGCDGTGDAGPAADLKATPLALTATGVDLVAIGTLSGHGGDLSRETAAPLENGLPGNLLGGLGSGLAFAGGNTFFALPDRGPNATPYNPAVDDTASFIPRVQRLALELTDSPAGSPLPLALTPVLRHTTLLSSRSPLVYGAGTAAGLPSGAPALNDKHTFYFSGRSDNFDPAALSTNPNNGRLDPESIRVANDGGSFFVSDEYGPFVYQFQRGNGRRIRAIALPAELGISHLSAKGDTEISGNTVGRIANKGMEGLALTPDGLTLVGAMQSPLEQDKGTNGAYTRLVIIDVASGATRQVAYPLTNIGTVSKPKYPTLSDIAAVNNHEFLVDERDGKGLGDNSTAAFKKIYRIDVAGAHDVSGLAGEATLAPHAIAKAEFMDVVATLAAHGINPNDIPAKLEGLAFGPDVIVDGSMKHTLFLANDNDFLGTITDSNHPAGIENPNKFFVFAIDPTALSTFEAQHLVADEGDRD